MSAHILHAKISSNLEKPIKSEVSTNIDRFMPVNLKMMKIQAKGLRLSLQSQGSTLITKMKAIAEIYPLIDCTISMET